MTRLSIGTIGWGVGWFDIIATRWTVVGRVWVSSFGSFPIGEIISNIISAKLILLLSYFCVCWWDDRTFSWLEVLCELRKHLQHVFFCYCARRTATAIAFTAVVGVNRCWDPSGDVVVRHAVCYFFELPL